MAEKRLTLQQIETHQQRLDREAQEDELALLMGLMGQSEMLERTVRREVEKRRLTMAALLLRVKGSNIIH